MMRRGDAAPRLTPEIIERRSGRTRWPIPTPSTRRSSPSTSAASRPHVAGPNEVKIITPLPEIEAKRVPIQKAYLLSCVNGRLEDIAEAAEVLRGKKVAAGREALPRRRLDHRGGRGAAARPLADAARRRRHRAAARLRSLHRTRRRADGAGRDRRSRRRTGTSRAGWARATPSSTSPPPPSSPPRPPPATSPRPAPRRGAPARRARSRSTRRRPRRRRGSRSARASRRCVEGTLLLVPKDNLNTDGIYGKDYTYRDDMTPPEMAKVAMLNYDPAFQEIAAEGDILVGGWNFGSGSSREQAATALKYRGLPLIVAGSYSQTYKRNAFNNGYIVIECPKLVTRAARALRRAARSRRSAPTWTARVDFEASEITVDGKTYPFGPLRDVAQELVALGGFESVLATPASGTGKEKIAWRRCCPAPWPSGRPV